MILDGKKGGLIKGSSPSSAAKKGYKKLCAETGKTSFNFELQETTKDSVLIFGLMEPLEILYAISIYSFKTMQIKKLFLNNFRIKYHLLYKFRNS